MNLSKCERKRNKILSYSARKRGLRTSYSDDFFAILFSIDNKKYINVIFIQYSEQNCIDVRCIGMRFLVCLVD